MMEVVKLTRDRGDCTWDGLSGRNILESSIGRLTWVFSRAGEAFLLLLREGAYGGTFSSHHLEVRVEMKITWLNLSQ